MLTLKEQNKNNLVNAALVLAVQFSLVLKSVIDSLKQCKIESL